ncbi:MAG TPA: YceH family protein [Acidimicrobiales bacterium]|nr:YceH family protein [Acidimicrobiales bacterium]
MNSGERTMALDLTAEEIRVLGCLVEKQATTPDNYPLSSNALMAACNQSTSRDPIVDYTERTIDATMLSLRDRGLARTVRGDGQRVHKHRHVLDEAWSLQGGSLGVMSVLMLRGAQTVAELRARTERYAGVGSSDDVDAILRRLAERDPPFAQLLPRRAGEREARWIHLVGEVAAQDRAYDESGTGGTRRASVDRSARTGGAEVLERVDALEAQIAEVNARLAALTERFETLASDLGAG